MQASGKRKYAMSGERYLLDSNVVIRLSKQNPSVLKFIENSNDLSISVVTYMEVLGYSFEDPRELLFLEKVLSVFRLIHIDQAIADQTVRIRRANKIKLPDAIIAATAQIQGMTLVTENISDFKKIEALLLLRK